MATPLAKKIASMYARPPAGYNRMDPIIVRLSMYRSVTTSSVQYPSISKSSNVTVNSDKTEPTLLEG